jgi:hypothetical protein
MSTGEDEMSEVAEHSETGVEPVEADQISRLQAALYRHGLMELERDLDGTMATVVDNPHYELVNVGWRLDGRAAVREMYRRMYAGPQPLTTDGRVLGASPNSLCYEVSVRFEPEVVSRDLTVLTFEGDLVASEVFYTDPSFTKVMRQALGDDFGDVPGVSKI